MVTFQSRNLILSVSILVLSSIFVLATRVYAISDEVGHSFKLCSSQDHLNIDQFTLEPDSPVAGEPLVVSFSGIPDVNVDAGKAELSMNVMGLEVGTISFDLCADLGVSCPLSKGSRFNGKVSYEIPEFAPSKMHVDVTLKVKNDKGESISCLASKVEIASAPASQTHEPMVAGCQFGWTVQHIEYLFLHWLEEFGRYAELTWFTQSKSLKETKSHPDFWNRLKIFRDNLVLIAKHNQDYRANKVTYGMKINQFAHLTRDEFASQRLGYMGSEGTARREERIRDQIISFASNTVNNLRTKVREIPLPNKDFFFRGGRSLNEKTENSKEKVDVPNSLDWVEKGAVTKVKDQGACGSCWAFSAIGALESAYFVKYGKLQEFSEQELVSCDKTCNGCGGGLMDLAFEWIQKNGGVCHEEDYPYKSGLAGINGWCKQKSCSNDPKTVPKEIVDVEKSEQALLEAVAKQPVAIAIEADQPAFQFYSGEGVVTGVCGSNLDHGVLLVGYGELDGIKYWKVKNSWGPGWGKEGYVLIERGKDVPSGTGECGILANASYVVL